MASSSIIGDAIYQELNMSFTFDEMQKDKLIICAFAEHTAYQLELIINPDLDFLDLKNALFSKHFKLVSKSPEILKLKIGITYLEFKNTHKITLDSLKQSITELSNKLKGQSQNNHFLEDTIHKMKAQIDLIKTQLVGLNRINNQKQGQYAKICKDLRHQMLSYNKNKEQSSEMEKGISAITQKQCQSNKYVKRIQTQQTELGQMPEKEGISKIIENKEINQCKISQLGGNNDDDLRQRINQLIQRMQKTEERLQSTVQQMTEILKLQLIQKLKQIDLTERIKHQNSHYKFSSHQKSSSIKLDDQKMKAVNPNQDLSDELALVQGIVFKKNSSIRFKIVKVGWVVAVGLGIRKVIKGNQYQLRNRKEIGHGCFLLFRSGWSYSHSKKQQNDVQTDFVYDEGDVIRVMTNVDELLFVNETRKKEFRQKMKMREEEWKEVCFCVRLYGDGECVEILNEGVK